MGVPVDVVMISIQSFDLADSNVVKADGLMWLPDLPKDTMSVRLNMDDFDFLRQAMTWADCDFNLIPGEEGTMAVPAEVASNYGERLAAVIPRLRVAVLRNNNPRATESLVGTLCHLDKFALVEARDSYLRQFPQDAEHDDINLWSVQLDPLTEEMVEILEQSRDFYLNCGGYYVLFALEPGEKPPV